MSHHRRQPLGHRAAAPAKVQFIQFIVIVSLFVAASGLSLAGGFIVFVGSSTPLGPVMIVCSTALVLAGIITAVVFEIRNNRTRRDHDN